MSGAAWTGATPVQEGDKFTCQHVEREGCNCQEGTAGAVHQDEEEPKRQGTQRSRGQAELDWAQSGGTWPTGAYGERRTSAYSTASWVRGIHISALCVFSDRSI